MEHPVDVESVELSDPDTYSEGVPHDVFRYLRDHDPVSWRHEVGGYWAVTRYHDAISVLRDPATFSSWKGGVRIEDPPAEFLNTLRKGMLNRDPPEHTALRRLVSKAFSPRRIAELEERIAEHARVLVERVSDREKCDFANEVAGEIPLFVICEILGVPLEDRKMLFTLTDQMFGAKKPDRSAAFKENMKAAEEMRAYGAALGRRKRENPGDDLVSDLLRAEIDGRALTDEEFQTFFMLLFASGSDTTRAAVCHGLNLLFRYPEVEKELRQDPSRIPSAVEEMLRFESPVIYFRRTAVRDVELGGKKIAEGDKLAVFFPSANRDGSVFENPDRFEISRTPNPHIAFGYGTHFCLGAPLARMEIKHLLREVLSQLVDLEPCAAMEISRSNFVRGVDRFEIRFKPAR